MIISTKAKLLFGGLAVLGLGGIMTLTVNAAIPDNGQINACYRNVLKTLRVTDIAGDCNANETPLSWSQNGSGGGPKAYGRFLNTTDASINHVSVSVDHSQGIASVAIPTSSIGPGFPEQQDILYHCIDLSPGVTAENAQATLATIDQGNALRVIIKGQEPAGSTLVSSICDSQYDVLVKWQPSGSDGDGYYLTLF
jgi:hypothetical protein